MSDRDDRPSRRVTRLAALAGAAAAPRPGLRWVRWIMQYGGLLLAVVALAPDDWANSLTGWARLLWDLRQGLALVVALGLLVRLVQLERAVRRLRTGRSTLDPGAGRSLPVERTGARLTDLLPGELPDLAENLAQWKLVLASLAEKGGHHTVRIVVATGQAIIELLDDAVHNQDSRASFRVQLLLMDPEDPLTRELGTTWPAEARKTIGQVRALDAWAATSARPVRLEVRVYRHPPPVRALLVDEEHLFFGFMEWSEVNGRWELHHPQARHKSYVYVHNSHPLAAHFLDFVQSWFDYNWEQGRVPAESGNTSAMSELPATPTPQSTGP